MEAEDPEDQMYLGGRWSPESLLGELTALRGERDAALAALAAAKL